MVLSLPVLSLPNVVLELFASLDNGDCCVDVDFLIWFYQATTITLESRK